MAGECCRGCARSGSREFVGFFGGLGLCGGGTGDGVTGAVTLPRPCGRGGERESDPEVSEVFRPIDGSRSAAFRLFCEECNKTRICETAAPRLRVFCFARVRDCNAAGQVSRGEALSDVCHLSILLRVNTTLLRLCFPRGARRLRGGGRRGAACVCPGRSTPPRWRCRARARPICPRRQPSRATNPSRATRRCRLRGGPRGRRSG